MAELTTNEKESKFKGTLNLPKTDFPLRAHAAINDPLMIKRWREEAIFRKSSDHNKGKETYILHDGPPYANGHIHLGTAYNKILKDIICKSQRMMGKHVPVTPGWDCHGLPIELKVTKEFPTADAYELKTKCRAYAYHWIEVQKKEFQELGVFMNWDHPYLTMSPSYEASIMRAFGEFVDKGYIERKNKTVPWCISCQTVLASAEIEYYDRKDPSLYVLFQMNQTQVDVLFPAVKGNKVYFIVWTTTPWTLALNRALLLKTRTDYALILVDNQYMVIGKNLVDQLVRILKKDISIITTFISDELVAEHTKAIHPFIGDVQVPLILDASVAIDEGTAIVHCAPGCGPQDYDVGIQHNLEIFSPISIDGKYQKGILPAELEGISVLDALGVVISLLQDNNALLYKTTITHAYPHCWRCRKGLIFRATKQWFCDLSKHNLKQRVLESIDSIKTFPEKSKNRLLATIEGRLEWCLSRQRVWGVPIPALICTQCDRAYTTKEFVDAVASHVEQQGIEYWDTIAIEKLVSAQFSCQHCGKNLFRKEVDILDVWFDSGVSHYAVLKNNDQFPATLYLEGKDQHRGWFQSSLLTSLVLNNTVPMQQILTHGYTVDEQGRKMSKSLGNVIAPSDMIQKMGTDGLRLWVASADYGGELVVSGTVIENIAQVVRKIRNTCRFLLSNLYDFDPEKDMVALDVLSLIDKQALYQLFGLQYNIKNNYNNYNLPAIFHLLTDYCTVDLSAFYLDIIKDRLYVEQTDGLLRRSAQTVCWYILDTLTKLMAPIVSFTAEELSDHYQKNKKCSIHLQDFASLDALWELIAQQYRTIEQQSTAGLEEIDQLMIMQTLEIPWKYLKKIRTAVLKHIEVLRAQGIIKHSLEARVIMYIDSSTPMARDLDQLFKEESRTHFFKEFFIVSQCVIQNNKNDLSSSEIEGLHLRVEKALGIKCPRCWNWDVTEDKDGLCNRCQKVVYSLSSVKSRF